MADKNKNISIKKLIYNDKYLIIFALLLAVLIWTITSLNIGIDETKTISVNVPIELSDELSEQFGMQYYSLQDTVTVDVTVSGAKYVVGQVSENDLAVKFDTSSVNKAGEQSIPILVTNKSKTLDFNVTSIYPSSIDAYFDVNETKTFDLYLSYDETNVADGYFFGTPVMSEDKVVISGPKTYVERIEKTAVNVDFGNNKELKEPYNTDCDIEIIGTGVESSYLTMTSRSDSSETINTVNVTLSVFKETTLPVSVEFDEMPSALPSDAIDVSYSVDKLSVGVLDSANISSAVIGRINFNQLKVGENRFTFDLTKLQGITVVDSSIKKVDVVVAVSDDYEENTVKIDAKNIVIEGVTDGYNAVIKNVDYTNVSVISPRDSNIAATDLTLKCDLGEQTESGTYPISISVNDNSSWIYYTYNASVEITKK